MKRFLPLAFLTALFLLTLLRASASWASANPACLEGEGWHKLGSVDGQFITHIADDGGAEHRAKSRGRRRHPKSAPSAPPKHEGLDTLELWEQPSAGPVAEPENRSALLIQDEAGQCLAKRVSAKGTGHSEIALVPLSREVDAVQVKTSFPKGGVRESTELFEIDKKDKSFRQLWTAVTIQLDPATGKPQESKIEYLDANSDNYTDIALTDAAGKTALWKWNPKKNAFDTASK